VKQTLFLEVAEKCQNKKLLLQQKTKKGNHIVGRSAAGGENYIDETIGAGFAGSKNCETLFEYGHRIRCGLFAEPADTVK